MVYAVTCITKHSAYDRITHLGCIATTSLYQRFSEEEAIKRIKDGDTFHVKKDGHDVKVVIAEHEGREYLKTERDSFKPDNLLALDRCKEITIPSTPPVRTTPAGSHMVR